MDSNHFEPLTGMTGPDFLDAVADQHAAHGSDINADTFRQRALQWKRDVLLRERAERDLQDARDRLEHIAEHAIPAPSTSGALTPTHSR